MCFEFNYTRKGPVMECHIEIVDEKEILCRR
jgi:hypothetical protein